jgi:hypothetical protein
MALSVIFVAGVMAFVIMPPIGKVVYQKIYPIEKTTSVTITYDEFMDKLGQ